MYRSTLNWCAGALMLVVLVATPLRVHADAQTEAVCKKTIVTQLLKYEKIHLKNHEKCLDKENKGTLPGPCPDAFATLKIATTNSKVAAKIGLKCTMADITNLGYRADCAYEPATAGIEGQCAGLPVTTSTEFAECMKCWKSAELAEFVAIIYASHANEVCGGALDDTSTVCSDLDCASPLPEQRNLGDNSENDCQVGIGKAAVKYLVKRAKILEKCLLKGGTEATCTADPEVALKLSKLEISKQTLIKNKCGNRDPSPASGFCCRCGTANSCMVENDRSVCEATAGCSVQEGKTCDGGTLKCDPGPKQITWWANCPESATDTCPGTPLATLDDLIDCVDSSADAIVDELLCLQFPNTWSCPAPDPTPTPTP